MHSLLTRANALFAFTLSVLAAVTFACFLTTVLEQYATPAVLKVTKAQVKNLPDYSAARARNDLGYLHFDIQVDVTPLFNWNVKQLFLYMIAEYQTNNNPVNEVVLWDKIIQRGDHAVIDIEGGNQKYYFWDDGNGLIGHKNVTLRLFWNVVPNAGHLPLASAQGSHTFSFPDQYTTSKF